MQNKSDSSPLNPSDSPENASTSGAPSLAPTPSETGGTRLTDLYYLAGFFDGEGSIGIAKSSLQVRVVNSYRPTIELFKRTFGGVVAIHHAGDDKTRLTWEWRAYGDVAAASLAAMLPLLHEKAPQAYLGLHFRTLQPNSDARAQTRVALGMLKKTTHYRP